MDWHEDTPDKIFDMQMYTNSGSGVGLARTRACQSAAYKEFVPGFPVLATTSYIQPVANVDNWLEYRVNCFQAAFIQNIESLSYRTL